MNGMQKKQKFSMKKIRDMMFTFSHTYRFMINMLKIMEPFGSCVV